MKKYLKNNRRLIHNFKCLSLRSTLNALCSELSAYVSKLLVLSSMLLTLLILCWLLFPNRASSGPYLDSAHGNTTYGVNRTSLSSFNYSMGNCAHCHEQHASIGGAEPDPVNGAPSKYLLFRPLFIDQADAFCYACHKDPGTSNQILMPNQYLYSRTAGGDTTISCPDDIKEAFQFVNNSGTPQLNCSSNQGSSHLLKNIETFLAGRFGYDKFSICSGCHNPHRAQKDPHTPTGRIVSGKLVSAVSRPIQHTDLTTWELWGNDSTERMSNKAASLGGTYCSPYNYNSTTTREPDDCSSPSTDCSTDCSNGLHLVDYVSLCTDCHNSTNVINSTVLGRNLYRINWSASGDFHGGQARIDNGGDFSGAGEFGDILDPYKSGGMPNYILSCTDCHEPHGAPNEFLLRQTLNGSQVNTFSSSGRWYNWCQTCHSLSGHLPPVNESLDCFQAGACHRHCDPPACGPNRLF